MNEQTAARLVVIASSWSRPKHLRLTWSLEQISCVVFELGRPTKLHVLLSLADLIASRGSIRLNVLSGVDK